MEAAIDKLQEYPLPSLGPAVTPKMLCEAPRVPVIHHITHIQHLASIVSEGAVLCDAEAANRGLCQNQSLTVQSNSAARSPPLRIFAVNP